jgi:hypothetical protein
LECLPIAGTGGSLKKLNERGYVEKVDNVTERVLRLCAFGENNESGLETV